ncbi:MAG: DUF2339 domain-containing protein [Desulfobacteraceae bacterium]|nr:DUF2339 domain-containing protein [Desulfobacteraceae bacterium]
MIFLILVLGIIGAVLGAVFLPGLGWVPGFAIGLLLGWCKVLSARVGVLEQKVAKLKAGPEHETKAPGPEAEPESEPEVEVEPELELGPELVFGQETEPADQPEAVVASGSLAQKHEQRPGTAPAHVRENAFDPVIEKARQLLTRGNPVVRVGLIVLFFGVAFLLKYAAERDLLAIELRLAAVAFAGLAMLALGWRLRSRDLTYSLLIQGGGVGILYLTIFASSRIYGLVPLGLAFALMIAMVGLSVLLALLQNSVAMAAFGAIGGFLAPVLISPGTGSHVVLFSYYALLNAGILGIAWFKSWRVLNWIGFMFTFVIGMTWGYRFYRPEFFHTTEPFLILFFLFYLAISIMFAHRQPVHLKGYIDGTLVFGLPAVVFGLQGALVYEYEYAMAISALAMGGIYITLASVLWRKRAVGMKALTESFLSLGVVFTSIAIPLGLDSNWVTALWCLEGAGLVWIGVRQHRILARLAGLLLQIGAGIAFITGWGAVASGLKMPVLNSVYMSAFLLSLSGFVSNYCYQHYSSRLRGFELWIHLPLLGWALLWWLAGGFREINFYFNNTELVFACVVFIAASGWVFGWLNQRLQWEDTGYPAMAAVPMVLIITLATNAGYSLHPFEGWGVAAWGITLFLGCHLLYRLDQKWPEKLLGVLHLLMLIFVVFILTREAGWVVDLLVKGTRAWPFAVSGFIPALFISLLLRFGSRVPWPTGRFRSIYTGEGLLPMGIFLLGWVISACFRPADPAPLAYIPLINPVEFTQVFVLLTLMHWWNSADTRRFAEAVQLSSRAVTWVMLAAAFLWINSVIARSVHFWAFVEFSGTALFASVYFQSALSIVWTLISLVLMAAATSRGKRMPWIVGAALLGIVVAKLFLVDLSEIGTVARIISFIVVGSLMLVIGYLSPLPPKSAEDGI